MKIDLTNVIFNYDEKIDINLIYSFGNEYLDISSIEKLEDVSVVGKVIRLDDDTFSLRVNVSGTMELASANHLFSFEIDEILTDNDALNEEYIKISDNAIDILPIIWQNIVLEIPLEVSNPD